MTSTYHFPNSKSLVNYLKERRRRLRDYAELTPYKIKGVQYDINYLIKINRLVPTDSPVEVTIDHGGD